MAKFFLFIYVILFFVSCSSSQVVETKSQIVSLTKGETEQEFSKLFYDFQITILNTRDEVFRSIDKLYVWNGQYYIMDKTGKKNILVFSMNGDYQYSIGTPGKGHSEYANLEDFTIDKNTGNVVLLSYPSTVFVYDKTGKFLSSKKIEDHTMLWNIISHKNGFVCSTNHCTYTEGEHAYLLYFFDNDFKFKDKRIPVLPSQVQLPPFVSCPLYIDDDNMISYFDNYRSSLYLINDNDSISVKEIKYDISNYVPNDIFANPMDFMSKQMDYDYVMDVIRINNEVVVFHSNKGKIYYFRYRYGDEEAVENRYIDWMPKILCVDNGRIYSSMSPKSFSMYKELFPDSVANLVKTQDNDMILSFKMR